MPKPYFVPRASGLYVRFLVPKHARDAIGSRYVVRSLGMLRGDAARLAAAGLGYALAQQFDTIRGRVSEPGKPPLKVVFRIRTGNELLRCSIEVRADVTQRISAEGPGDHALAMEERGALGPEPCQSVVAPLTRPPPAIMLGERIALFLAQFAQKQRAVANVLDTTHSLTLFVGIVGDKPLATIGPEDTDKWLDALAHWPPNASKRSLYKGLSPVKVVALAKRRRETPISPRTREKHLDRLRVFFNWCVERRDIDHNPCASLHVMTREQQNTQSRREFIPAELAVIFDPDLRDAHCDTPARWWLPLLALYSGGRAQELAQLHTQDIEQVAGAWGFHIAARYPGQRLKNRQSNRFVPLHPTILDAGFLAYHAEIVEALGDGPLFPGLGATKPGDVLGDWFNRTYLRKHCAIQGQVFHCFRHTFIGAADRAGISESHLARITGHGQGGSVLRGYYIDVQTLPERSEAVASVGFSLPHIDIYQPGQFKAFIAKVARSHQRRSAIEARAPRRRVTT